MQDPKVIVALDYSNTKEALDFLDKVEPSLCKIKVGKELFTTGGPQFVEKIVNKEFDVFLDLKFHDIPNTVAKACKAASELGVWMMNVHCLGGFNMMQAAREALDEVNSKALLIGVTILTSMSEKDLQQIGISQPILEQVKMLASLAEEAGLNGVVCSPKEVVALRKQISSDFKLVTPGIRPPESEKGDQTRVMTPAEAMQAGSSYLVIGRPITQANEPLDALKRILEMI